MSDEFYCQICQDEPEAFTRSYAEQPFLDGRNYTVICHRCAAAVRTWDFDEQGEIVETLRLCSVEEMGEMGWQAEDAQYTLDCIGKLLADPALLVESELGVHIFNRIISQREIELAI